MEAPRAPAPEAAFNEPGVDEVVKQKPNPEVAPEAASANEAGAEPNQTPSREVQQTVPLDNAQQLSAHARRQSTPASEFRSTSEEGSLPSWQRAPPTPPSFARRGPVALSPSPSSLARKSINARHLSPSARAKYHEERYKANRAKSDMSRGPGPGAYSPQLPPRQTSFARYPGTSTFNSDTRRMRDPRGFGRAKDVGDPGAYNPNDNRDLASQASSTSSKSSQAGKAKFGTSTKRYLPHEIVGDNTPGPSDYDPIKLKSRLTTRCGVSMHSETPQRPQPHNSDLPGVGSYQPRETLVTPSPASGAISHVGRESRYGGDSVTTIASQTGEHIGPGSYHPEYMKNGRRTSFADDAAEPDPGSGWQMISDSLRNVFAFLLTGEVAAQWKF